MQTRSCALLVALASLGCAASTGTQANSGPEPERVTVISAGNQVLEIHSTADGAGSYWADAPIERVWAVLPQVYEDLGVPLTVHDSVGKRIGNAGFRARRIGGSRLSQFLRCGTGVTATPNADSYLVTMSLTTRLSEPDVGGTTIVTLFRATAKPRDVGGMTVNCASTGKLESRISEMVTEKLAG
jgi:hypothetical protein